MGRVEGCSFVGDVTSSRAECLHAEFCSPEVPSPDAARQREYSWAVLCFTVFVWCSHVLWCLYCSDKAFEDSWGGNLDDSGGFVFELDDFSDKNVAT